MFGFLREWIGSVTPLFAQRPLRHEAARIASPDRVQPCPLCGDTCQRSKARGIHERIRKRLTPKRLLRCGRCGWRGWRLLLDDGLRAAISAEPVDLEQLDKDSQAGMPSDTALVPLSSRDREDIELMDPFHLDK